MKYGGDGTIHQTGHVDVEVGPDGHVYAVWFRCVLLPFKQIVIDWDRASDMEQAYKLPQEPLVSVEFEEPLKPRPRYEAILYYLSFSTQEQTWRVIDNKKGGHAVATFSGEGDEQRKNAKEYAEWLNSKAR